MDVGKLITVSVVALIVIVTIYYFAEAGKIKKASKAIRDIYEDNNTLDAALKNAKLNKLSESYQKSICIQVTDGKTNTNIPSQEFFNELNLSRSFNFNLKQLDSASSALVGLGLLGTFGGLTYGIYTFQTGTAIAIQMSIQTLLEGMGIAFLTSLAGMACSLVFTTFYKSWRNKLSKHLHILTNKLDDLYYIDDIALMGCRQQKMMERLYADINTQILTVLAKMDDGNAALKAEIGSVAAELKDDLTYTNEEGGTVKVGNAVREILKENSQQTAALKSFSTDLAGSLENVFDEVLSNQMKDKLLPVLENLDTTIKQIVEHIDKVAETVTNPAADMMKSVLAEMRSVNEGLMNEFKTSFSESSKAELEKLSATIGLAVQAISKFPDRIDGVSATMENTASEMKSIISEISESSASANKETMKQMKEQADQMATTMADASLEMSQMLKTTVTEVTASVKQVMDKITDDVASKQLDLLSIQEDVVSSTRELLGKFNSTIESMDEVNKSFKGSLSSLEQTEEHIEGSTSNLESISSQLKQATEKFSESQNTYTELQQELRQNIDSVLKALQETNEMGDEYVNKFELIKVGLASIFKQLQEGLAEYSTTVSDSTQKYLDQYSTSLTNATDALSTTVQQQNEVVELLNESINKLKER